MIGSVDNMMLFKDVSLVFLAVSTAISEKVLFHRNFNKFTSFVPMHKLRLMEQNYKL